MRGGSGGKIRAIGPGDKDFSSIQFLALIDHGGRRLPTATMKPHSRRLSIQQSANIDVSQFSVRYEYVLFGAPDQGQTLDVYRSDF